MESFDTGIEQADEEITGHYWPTSFTGQSLVSGHELQPFSILCRSSFSNTLTACMGAARAAKPWAAAEFLESGSTPPTERLGQFSDLR